MGTTPNYSWPYPENSDPVADGATDMKNLADAADASVATLDSDIQAVDAKIGLVSLYSAEITGTPVAWDVPGFSATYRNYRLVLSNFYGTPGYVAMRFGTSATLYFGANRFIVYTGTLGNYLRNNGSNMVIVQINTNVENSATVDIEGITDSFARTTCHGTHVGGDANGYFGFFQAAGASYTSVRLFSSSGTFSGGHVALYGYK